MTHPTDDDLIRRGDALMACGMVSRNDEAAFVENLLKSLPAASQPADPVTNAGCCQQVRVKPPCSHINRDAQGVCWDCGYDARIRSALTVTPHDPAKVQALVATAEAVLALDKEIGTRSTVHAMLEAALAAWKDAK